MKNEKDSWMNKKKNDKSKRRISGNGQEIKNKANENEGERMSCRWCKKNMEELKKWEENIQTANKNHNCEIENRKQK